MLRRYPILLLFGLIFQIPFTLSLRAHPDLLLQIESLSAQISEDPQNTELYIRRGDLYRRHGERATGERDFLKVRELAASHPLIDWYEGRLLVEAGYSEEGAAMLSRFLESRPDFASAYRVRGAAHLDLGQPQLAARDFQSAIDHSEWSSPSHYRSLVLALVAAGQTAAADAAVADGLNRFPGEITLLGLGVDLSLAQSDSRQALGYMASLPEGLSKLPQWQFRQALLACIEGDLDTAVRKFSAMLSDMQTGDGQRAFTWSLPLEVMTGLVTTASENSCSLAAIQVLRRQHP